MSDVWIWLDFFLQEVFADAKKAPYIQASLIVSRLISC